MRIDLKSTKHQMGAYTTGLQLHTIKSNEHLRIAIVNSCCDILLQRFKFILKTKKKKQ